MQNRILSFITLIAFLIATPGFTQNSNDTIVLRDIEWDKSSPASQLELTIPSGNSLMQGFMYKANGKQKHPTLLLLHGYPGNERNLDLAQVVRARGWNVIYFNYRGAWGSQGQFSFKNCVEDVVHVVEFCKKYQDSLQIDTANIALFGHSMGGWICLKALQQLPGIKKGFALSAWDIAGSFKNVKTMDQMMQAAKYGAGEYFVLNTPLKDIFEPVFKNFAYYNLVNDTAALASKQIIMLDESNRNKEIADALKATNKSYFDYEIWHTDHPFTNKRVALIKKLLEFLNK
jgi:uncharacterized protein